MEVFYEALARHRTVAYLFQIQRWVSVLSHMGFRVVAYVCQPHRRSVLRSLLMMPYGPLGAPALTCLFSTCLSVTCLSITFLSI